MNDKLRKPESARTRKSQAVQWAWACGEGWDGRTCKSMQMHEQVGSSAALPPPEHLRTTRARSRRVSDACTCAQCRPAHVLHALRRGSVWSGRAGLRTCCRFLSSTRTSSPRCPVLGAPCGARAKQQRGHVRGASLPSVSDTFCRYEGFYTGVLTVV